MTKVSCCSPLLILAVAVTGLLGPGAARAGDPQVTVQLAQKGKVFAYAFFVDELLAADDGLPLVKVKFGGVLLSDGRFVKKVRLNRNERRMYRTILREKPGFRLFLSPDQVGIFRYVEAAEDRIDSSGIIFQALAHDNDNALREMTEDLRERNRLENLLDMSIDEAADVVEKEKELDRTISRWSELELAILRKPDALENFDPFFVQTARPK